MNKKDMKMVVILCRMRDVHDYDMMNGIMQDISNVDAFFA